MRGILLALCAVSAMLIASVPPADAGHRGQSNRSSSFFVFESGGRNDCRDGRNNGRDFRRFSRSRRFNDFDDDRTIVFVDQFGRVRVRRIR